MTQREYLPALAVCGFSGAGKTTLIEALLPTLVRRGLRVAVVKHDAHGPQVDRPGKDSDRLYRAGADVLLHGPGESFFRCHEAGGETLERALALLAPHYDLVLVEGHKNTPLPRVWLLGPGETAPPALDGLPPPLAVLPRDSDRPAQVLALLDEWLPRRLQTTPLYGCILIGGRGRRMGGRAKQLMTDEQGVTWGEKIAAVLSGHCREVVFAGAGALPPATPHERLPDCREAAGPLAGLLAAMRWAPRASWLVCACDMPRFDAAAVRWLLAQRRPGIHAVLPRLPGGRPAEPLGAWYDFRFLPYLEQAAAAGERRLTALADNIGPVAMPLVPEDLAPAWTNINRPEELKDLALRP